MATTPKQSNPIEISIFFSVAAVLAITGILFRYDEKAAGFFFFMTVFLSVGLYLYGAIDPAGPIGFLHDPKEKPAKDPTAVFWRSILFFVTSALCFLGLLLRLKFARQEHALEKANAPAAPAAPTPTPAAPKPTPTPAPVVVPVSAAPAAF